MGFFDTVRDKAGSLAADAERAGKVTAAQARLVVLQSDLRKAERELGHEAFVLIDRGELEHPELAAAIARLRATEAEIRAKEAEIEALRGGGAEAAPAVAIPVPAVPGQTIATPEEPAGQEATEPKADEEQPAATAPAKAPAPKKAPAKKAPARKPAAKKAPVKKSTAKKPTAKDAPAAPPRAASKAGATPKKSGKPSSAGPRPAGKKKPAGS